MDESESYSYSYSNSYSYSYSTTSSTRNEAEDAMWAQIARIPVDLLEKTDDFLYIEKVLSLIPKYDFNADDPNMAVPERTVKVGRLLKLVASQCSRQISKLGSEKEGAVKNARETEAFLKKKIELQNSELARLRRMQSEGGTNATEGKAGDGEASDEQNATPQEEELRQLRAENDMLSFELRKLTRNNDELQQTLNSRRQEQTQTNGDSDKQYLEYRHLVARHRRLLEKSKRTEDMLEELRTKDRDKRQHTDSELERLREKVKQLQQENLALIGSRDHAEELCEKREAEALRDMTELRRLTRDLIDEERGKVRQIREEYASLKQEADAHIEEMMQQHDEDLRSKDQEVELLRHQLEKAAAKRVRRFDSDASQSNSFTDSQESSSSPASASDDPSASQDPSSSLQRRKGRRSKKSRAPDDPSLAALRKLERQNDDLQAEMEEMEIRAEALEDENRRLTRLVRDYEDGEEGLSHLRHELEDATRTVEVLQEENAQLRERLNGMEDSLAFTAALQELCRRMGVTEEELSSLKPQNAAAYSEMDTLKEELAVMKEEVEWLERERRHWMNKVRLQPLMDTKLRFELGLTSEQLRQLDNLVDQMKAGSLIVEDEDKSYKEKYFAELEARRREAAQFNDYVKNRIEDALKHALGAELGSEGSGEAATALTALKDHIDLLTITTNSSGAAVSPEGLGITPAEFTRRQLREQLDSTRRQVEQLQLTAKDNTEVITRLRESLSATNAEAEIVAKERDQYREAIFAAAGVHSAPHAHPPDLLVTEPGDSTALEGTASSDIGAEQSGLGLNAQESSTISKERMLGFQSKWAAISNTLREQLTAKDSLIDELHRRLASLQATIDGQKDDGAKHVEAINVERRLQEELKDQISALQHINEDLSSENRGLQSTNNDLLSGMQNLDENSKTKELLQKVVLLRRREAKLMSRLRSAITAQEDAVASEKKMRRSVDHTLASLREALEGSSTGFVLPPSTATHKMEEEQLEHVHSSVKRLLGGKLFREDSAYLLHLQQVYQNLERNEELTSLRLRERDLVKKVDSLQTELDQLQVALTAATEARRRAGENDESGSSRPTTPAHLPPSPHSAAAASKWESESIMWRQKYELAYKRLEGKDAEVALLEKELDTARQEIVDTKDHVRNILSGSDAPLAESGKGPSIDSPAADDEGQLAGKVARYEKEVARLKSINLGLLQHTLDLQASTKTLEVDLEARTQELTLLRSSSDTDLINSFVSSAVREHAALRRQSELAIIQARRMKVQLAATEANYQVVANEATAYKLSAYRLYRRYVDEMVGVVDYIRCIQRASKGALSPHRVEIMDQRFRRLADELAGALARNKSMATDLSDRASTVTTLQQQLKLQQMERGSAERQDAAEVKLREARAALREAVREITEYKEDAKHAERKVHRLEQYAKELTNEITRLEFGSLSSFSPLDEELLRNLTHLKDTVFAKAEAPPLAITAPATTSNWRDTLSAPFRSNHVGGDDDPDVAVREYKAAVMKQKELSKECERLRLDVTMKTKEAERFAATVEEQADVIRALEEKASFYQKQCDDERGKAEIREGRLRQAHETQAEVSRRAMEHNAKCLREMLQKKESEIAQLRTELDAERRRCVEQQLEETSRMEKVHESMFRENNALVERFRAAINNVSGSIVSMHPPILPGSLESGDAASNSAVFEQLRFLTSETIRLQRELETVRTTNIVLESQLSNQLDQAKRSFMPSVTSPHAPHITTPAAVAAADATPQRQGSNPVTSGVPPSAAHLPPTPTSGGVPYAATPSVSFMEPAPASPAPTSFATPAEHQPQHRPLQQLQQQEGGGESHRGSHETLVAIVKSQTAMIESLRQREASITEELQQEKQRGAEAQKALEELRARLIEKDATQKLVSQVSSAGAEPAAARELRMQLAYVEQELRMAREQLEQERSAARQLQSDAATWKESLAGLQLQIANQQVEVDRARHLSTLNEGLQGDLNALKDQNDKLVLASSLLKQKLLDEARKGGDSSRQHQHEVALAQRMGALQQESAVHMKALDARIKEIQKELNARMAKEKELLSGNEETQRLIFQLHQQLRAKDRELDEARARWSAARAAGGGRASSPAAATSRAAASGRGDERGTQTLHSEAATGATPAPRVATSPPPAAASSSPTAGPPSAHPAVAERDTAQPTHAAADPGTLPATVVNRELEKMQRDNLQQISLLRSTVGRLEKDLDEAREQLKGERGTVRLLRRQLLEAKKAAEEAETRHARELVDAHRRRQGGATTGGARRDPPADPLPPVQSPPPAPNASAEVAELQRRVALLEPKAAAADTYQRELTELRAAAAVPLTGSQAQVRDHVRTVANLEAVIDGLRHQVNVDAPARINELEHRSAALHDALLRMVQELAVTRGISVEEVRRRYVDPIGAVVTRPLGGERTVAALEAELLQKNNAMLELQFTKETLELRVSRLQRHLDDMTAAETHQARSRSQHAHNQQVAALEAVVGNLQVVIQTLQRENATLKEQGKLSARYTEAAVEVKQLRQREKDLQMQLQQLARGLAGSARASVPTASARPEERGARLEARLQEAKTSADTYHRELEQLRAQLEGSSGRAAAAAAAPVAPRASSSTTTAPQTDRRRVEPISSVAGLPPLEDTSSREVVPAALADSIPPPLPPAPVASTTPSSRGPHAAMRHHHVRRH